MSDDAQILRFNLIKAGSHFFACIVLRTEVHMKSFVPRLRHVAGIEKKFYSSVAYVTSKSFRIHFRLQSNTSKNDVNQP